MEASTSMKEWNWAISQANLIIGLCEESDCPSTIADTILGIVEEHENEEYLKEEYNFVDYQYEDGNAESLLQEQQQ